MIRLTLCLCLLVATCRASNVLIILADDMSQECLDVYGGAIGTPNLNQLAARGRIYTHAYAMPACSPTRYQLLTGLYTDVGFIAHGIWPEQTLTWAGLLDSPTCVTGKWQFNPPDGVLQFRNHCIWQNSTSPNRYYSPTLMVDGQLIDYPNQWGPHVHLRYAMEWMSKQTEDWVLYYSALQPHYPWVAPPGHPDYDARSVEPPPPDKGDPTYYGAMVRSLDAEIGALLAYLEAAGEAEDTYVLFLADNGSPRPVSVPLAGGGLYPGGKGATWDPGTQVPCILAGPGIPPEVTNRVFSCVDIAGLVLEVMGYQPPGQQFLDSRSPLSLDRNKVFTHFIKPTTGAVETNARNRRYRLYWDGRFFDTLADPFQESPLAREINPRRYDALQRLLERRGAWDVQDGRK